jgi:hypothetical protein
LIFPLPKIPTQNPNEQISSIAEDYFRYMARAYPVLCLSDEFYFFPRATKSIQFLHSLDSLDEEKIRQDIAYVKNLKSLIEKVLSRECDQETYIDAALLQQSMVAYLKAFGEIEIWRIDPSIYLKIIFLGIDHIVNRFSSMRDDADECLMARMKQIPYLINQAKRNLETIPSSYYHVALEMIEVSGKVITAASRTKQVLRKKARASLDDFKKFLLSQKPAKATFARDRSLLEGIVTESFSYKRSLEEIFRIASETYQETQRQLKEIAATIKPGAQWQDIVSHYRLEARGHNRLLGLYSGQIGSIRNFLKKKDVMTIPKTQQIHTLATPPFMQPVRASASYSSPVTNDRRESACFYITAGKDFASIHNEYIFVTAHETYPGHHLLDTVRRRITNPIRQQIENPLFYEGWASYAERLIDELGYISDPTQKLIGLKRQAWRAVRAMMDAGIRIGKLTFDDTGAMLKDLGYAPRIVKSMLRHYVLSPGYQLCYTIGKFEFDRLKGQFAPKLGLKKFHDFILQGGQLPFDLIERRLASKLCRENS